MLTEHRKQWIAAYRNLLLSLKTDRPYWSKGKRRHVARTMADMRFRGQRHAHQRSNKAAETPSEGAAIAAPDKAEGGS